METTDEVPDWAKLWWDRDVAQFLHIVADRDFGGNVELAMNSLMRVIMKMYEHPENPWAAIEAHRTMNVRGAQEAARRKAGPRPAR